MKKFVYILVVSFLILNSCSTKKDTFVNRTYHSVTSTFNVLYNGNVALDSGIKNLADQYEDNFWEILPVEPLHIDEEKPLVIPGEGDNTEKSKTPFEVAEEKAVKAIQKHSMTIDGVEKNKQADAAYLLLGKSRYYSQRFVPALEAFDFLLKNFHNDDLSNDLRIWKAKTQIRLQNEDRAIKTLTNLISYKDIEGETKEKAHTSLAMAHIANDSIQLAIIQLRKATETHYNKNQYARNLMILGQLYRNIGENDSATWYLKKILNFKKSPHRYKMHSYIEQAKNITDSTNYTDLQQQLKKLIKVYENKEYLDEFYYQTALMDFRDGNDSLALQNLTRSTHSPSAKSYQMGLSYEKAGNYFFDKSQYVTAGSFYDSVLATAKDDNTKRIRKLKRKRKSLDEIITNETLIKNNDSILLFVAMSEAERIAYFEKYIEELKEKDKIAAIQKENKERSNTSGMSSFTNNPRNNTGKWYFYNAQTVSYGKGGFQSIWGNRELKDNWRLFEGDNNMSVIKDKKEDKELPKEGNTLSYSSISDVASSNRYNLDFYLNNIPSDEKVIQQMREETSNALFQLGLNYKEKFKEYPLATQRFERFLQEDPIEKNILTAKYHLYRIYEITDDPKLDKLKNEIIEEFPDSRFTEMINNPEKVSSDIEKKASILHYEKVYCDYEYEKYNLVLDQCNAAIEQYINDPIQRKFELLKSYAIYKTKGKKTFMTNLEYVVANFPKTEEAIHAQDMLDFLNGVKKVTKSEPKKNIVLPNGMNKSRGQNSGKTSPLNKTHNSKGNKSSKRSSSKNKNSNSKGPRNPFNSNKSSGKGKGSNSNSSKSGYLKG